MRIVQLVANLEIGGQERQVIDLAQQQKLSGHDPKIYCLFHQGPLAAEAAALGIPVMAFHKPAGLSLRTLWMIARQLYFDQPDVIQTHNAVVHHYGVLAAKIARVRVVVNTQHGTSTLSHDPKLRRIFRNALPWTNSVVMVAESVRTELVEKYGIPFRQTHVILNGIPLAKFAEYQAQPGSRRSQIRFGTVGRLTPAKDHRTLLAAFVKVLAALPQAELHIAGDGPLREELKEQVRTLNLDQHVQLHGARSDVAAFLSTLDVFVLSSVTEGLPVAALEAMAVGLPIVSTRAGGATEIASAKISEFCEPQQPEALAEAMLRMAQKTDLADIADAARKLARVHGVDQTWLQYEALYANLLDGKSSPGVERLPALHTQ